RRAAPAGQHDHHRHARPVDRGHGPAPGRDHGRADPNRGGRLTGRVLRPRRGGGSQPRRRSGPRTETTMTFNGKLRERLKNSWVEMRENFTRSTLQSLGVILGVASVLGGFSISDSMRKRSMELYVKMGGLDKLNVRQSAVIKEGAPTALQM